MKRNTSYSLSLIIPPFDIETINIRLESKLQLSYSDFNGMCEVCENNFGKIIIGGLAKTLCDEIVPIIAEVTYSGDCNMCHCDGDKYDGVKQHVAIKIRSAQSSLSQKLGFSEIIGELPDDLAFVFYRILVKENQSSEMDS